MKYLKYLLFSFLGLIVVLMLIATFSRTEYKAESSIIINRPLNEVFDFVSSLKHQDKWSIWDGMDSEAEYTYSGTDRQVGFISHWKGAESGEGEQEIVKIIPYQRIDFEIRFIQPFESISNVSILTHSVNENQTKVTWLFTGNLPFPFNIIITLGGFEKAIAKDFERGLTNLKKILESESFQPLSTE